MLLLWQRNELLPPEPEYHGKKSPLLGIVFFTISFQGDVRRPEARSLRALLHGAALSVPHQRPWRSLLRASRAELHPADLIPRH